MKNVRFILLFYKMSYSCKNTNKRKLCIQKCKTCLGRSFETVWIEKRLNGKNRPVVKFKPSKYWNVELNNGVLPYQVTKNSNQKFWFTFRGHTFILKLDECTRNNNWCPYMAGKILCSNLKCKSCYKRSYKSCFNSIEWYQEMNGDITPRDVLKNSHTMFYFICHVCSHYYQTGLDRRVKGDGCPYCNGDAICSMVNDPEIHGSSACKFCFDNSLISHDCAKDITIIPGYNPPDFDPRFVRKYSNKEIWFTCSEPRCKGLGHHFKSKIDNITMGGNWCPFCSSPPKRLCENDGPSPCKPCFENSLASSNRVDQISKNNDQPINPRQTLKNADMYVIFVCELCNEEFTMHLNNVSSGGQWCPNHVNKTEAKMFLWLKNKYPVEIIKEWRVDFCRNPETGRHLPYDFYIPSLKLIVEIDGPQHFVQVHNWARTPEETQKLDQYKEIMATIRGITVIRLLQTDVLYDKNDWENHFTNVVDEITVDIQTVNSSATLEILNPRRSDFSNVIRIYEGEIEYGTFSVQ